MSYLFDDDCTVIEIIDENWQKVSKDTVSKNGLQRKRSFLHCKRCNALIRINGKGDISNRDKIHFCSKHRQLSLMDTAKPSIEYAHYNFVAEGHLSMSQATSSSLYAFYKATFNAACNSFINSNPKIKHNYRIPKPEECYKMVQRTQFTSKFKEYALKIEEKCLEKFANKKICSLALDAGKVNSLPMLAVCLINPFNNIGAFLYKIIYYFGGYSIDYKNEVNIILDELISKNIVISSFIGDNLRAQTCALKNDGNECIQQTSDKAYIKTIEWTSCACHTTALGFKDTIESIELLSNFQNNLKIIVNFFRSKSVTSQLHLICPSYCATRWTNFTDIMLFFINKADQITDFLINNQSLVQKYQTDISQIDFEFENFIFEDITALYWLLIPYKCLINTLESDSFTISYLYPVFENFCSSLMQVAQCASDNGNDTAISYADSLISCIRYRFQDIYTQKLLKLYWFLTPAGRIQAREEYGAESELYSADANLIYVNIPQISIDQNKIQRDINNYTENSKKRIKDIKEARKNLIANKNLKDIDFTEFESEKIEYEQADIGLPNYDSYTSTLEEIENLIYEKAAKLIPILDEEDQISLIKSGKSIEDYPDFILNEYKKWILNGITSHSIMSIYKENPWSFWHQYKRLVPEKSIFAKFCIRILSISATSACCERAFHDINLEIPPDRMRTSEELVRYRINVRKHNDVLHLTI